jgi:DNA-binding SARP family transcriptional activator
MYAGAMEFGLLGPLEVILDGEVAVPTGRQQVVLAVLLLEVGRVVPVSRLVDAMWDDNPPLTAKSQVQICVSALRRILGRPGVIVTRPPGYLMRVAEDALDLSRFELLVAKGTAAAVSPHPADAVQHLRAALALWRGPAAAGVESKIVQAAVARLNERRLTVLEQCLDLELQLGRHHELIGELTTLVAQYPLRERLRAQLMLALYRSGRQAEALESYRTARATLIEELGLEPGNDLRVLEQAILSKDNLLDLSAGRRTAPQGRLPLAQAPHQLPTAIADFTGREEILDRVCAALSPAGDDAAQTRHVAVVTLSGKGGIGKTTLAIQAAHLLRDAYPDGQMFAQLQEGEGTPRSPAGILERFLSSFGVPPAAAPAALEDRVALYRSWLADRRILVILDDAVSIGQVTPLLPGSPGCAVIITSRNRLPGPPGAQQFEIGALEEYSGMELLARVIGPSRADAEQDAVRDLVRLCECLPLALRIVAAKLAQRPHWRVSQMVQRLTDERRRLDELDLEGVSVRATLSFSYAALGEQARRLLRRLSLLSAGDFASWVAAPLLDMDAVAAEDLLEDLVVSQLVEVRVTENGIARFRLHDLVRIYAVEQIAAEEPAGKRAAALRRLLGCWLFLAREAHRREYGGDFSVLHGNGERWELPADLVDALLADPIGWFQSEHAALVPAILQAAQAGLDELCWDLAMTSVTLFETGSYLDDWRETHEAALQAARSAGNRRGEAALLYSLGILQLTGRIAGAARDLELSLQLFEQLDDVHGRGLALSGLAFVDRLSGDYDAALSRCQLALAAFQQAGDLVGEAHMLKDMAQIQMDRQDLRAAERLLQEALAVCRNLGARRVSAQTWHQFAELLLRQEQVEQAEESFRLAYAAAEESGDIVGQAYALLGLGRTRIRHEQLAAAEADLRTALDLAARAGDLLIQGRVLLALAELNEAAARPAVAMSQLQEALDVLGALGSPAVWRARVLERMGRLQQQAGDDAAAARSWQAALELPSGADPALGSRLVQALARRDDDPGERSAAD